MCEFLAENDVIHSVRLIQYMRLLSNRSFPLTNISYKVFLDLVQWHSVSSDHKQMRYNPKVMQFWSVCKILFHTQMLEFMRGNDLVFDEVSQKLVHYTLGHGLNFTIVWCRKFCKGLRRRSISSFVGQKKSILSSFFIPKIMKLPYY